MTRKRTIKPVKTLLNLRGAVPKRGSGDLSQERVKAKASVGERVAEETGEAPKREPGSGKGEILFIADDFDAPLNDDFEEE